MILLRLAWQSLLNRRVTVALTVISVALSVALLLGVEKVRTGTKASFADTISGTDLIVGARSGGVQLLLYSVFRVGNATNNMSWDSYKTIADRDEVAWSVPLSLGDSHRNFRVLGTTDAFFDHYRYRGGTSVDFAEGAVFSDLFDTVIGSDVAAELGYSLDESIVISHGIASFTHHDDKPFRVSGILERTGTPVDRTVFVSLEAIEAIHVDWQTGGLSQDRVPAEDLRRQDLTPTAITAALIGVDSKLEIFTLQRWVNQYEEEPLMAILPGLTLAELWSIVGVAENALIAVSAMVVLTALVGMAAMIFSGLNERRREMAILRAVGARPRVILLLLLTEAALMCGAAVMLGLGLLYTILFFARSYIDASFGLYLQVGAPTDREWVILGLVILFGTLMSLGPAWRAYRMSLTDGMQVKI